MNDFPWLTILILVPLLGAVATAALPAGHRLELPKQVALGTSLLTLLLAVIMSFGYDLNGGFQFTEDHVWIKAFGAHYALGVDGLGLLMVLLTTVLVPIVIGASWYDADPGATLRDDDDASTTRHTKAFFAWALALEALSIAVFAATDVFLFYVVFEATLIPAYFLVGGFGGNQRRKAAVKFLIYQLAGGLVMLASVIGLYVVSAEPRHPVVPLHRPAGHHHRSRHPEVAVRRLLHRVRGQGPAVPGPHLATGHHRAGHHRHKRPARRASSTRSAPTGCCASASSCSPTARSGRRRW